MDFKQIQELIKMINKSNIGEVSIEDGEFKITIRQKEETITQVVASTPSSFNLPQVSQPTAEFPSSSSPLQTTLPSSAPPCF